MYVQYVSIQSSDKCHQPVRQSVLPVVKCLRQGGWGGGGGGQAGRVGMVRRLLQCLDQVVPILRIYGPQRAFAYALKEGKKEKKERGREGGSKEGAGR